MEEKTKAVARLSGVLLLVILISIPPLMCLGSTGVHAISTPPFSLSLFQTEQTAYVAPGQDGIVIFNGQITYHSSQDRTVVFEIQAECNGWNTSKPGPYTVDLNRSGTIPFNIIIKVPVGTSQKVAGLLKIYMKYNYTDAPLSGRLGPVTGIISIRPYYDFIVDPIVSTLMVHQDDDVYVVLNLTNTGNCNERIRGEVFNLKELQNKGLKCSLVPDKFEIEEDSFRHVKMILNTSMDTKMGDHKVILRFMEVNSIWENDHTEMNICVRILEKELLGVSLSVWILAEGIFLGVVGIVLAYNIIARDMKKNPRRSR